MSKKDLGMVSQHVQRLSTIAVEESKASMFDSKEVRENKRALREQLAEGAVKVAEAQGHAVQELSILEIDLRKGQLIASRAIQHQVLRDSVRQAQFEEVAKAVIDTNEVGVHQERELSKLQGPIAELALRVLREQTKKTEDLLFSVIEK